MRWINYGDAEAADQIALEMVRALSARPLPPAEKLRRVAAINALRDLAAHGELFDGDEIAPVSTDPDLWELRWRFGQEVFRQYHYEPPWMPGWLVALRFHRKLIVTDDEAETRRLQNLEIALAGSRLREGRAREWGQPC